VSERQCFCYSIEKNRPNAPGVLNSTESLGQFGAVLQFFELVFELMIVIIDMSAAPHHGPKPMQRSLIVIVLLLGFGEIPTKFFIYDINNNLVLLDLLQQTSVFLLRNGIPLSQRAFIMVCC
jgi:hypothetical protein